MGATVRKKADSEQIRRQNRGLVLETLRREGKLARVELGRATGLSPATITSISSDLIEEQIIRMADDAPREMVKTGPGRPLVRLEISPSAALVLAIKISIDQIDFALADYAGSVTDRATVGTATFDTLPEEFATWLILQTSSYLKRNVSTLRRIRHIGIAVQGFADVNRGTIVWSPAFRARNIPITAPLNKAFGIPCTIANDANMIAQSLLAHELARFSGTAAIVYIGPGVGMGLIIGGTVYSGSTGSAAEFGHMNHVPDGPICRCGQRGCIEAYAANYGIYRMATGDKEADAPHSAVPDSAMQALEAEARAGNAPALAAFQKAGHALGFGIARVTALLSPERVYFAGPGVRAYPLMEASVHEGLEKGLVADLRQGVGIEVIEWSHDRIVGGIVSGALRHLDREVFSSPGNAWAIEAAQ
jgi:predicted NBD/HSP70 family sugar kinase